MGNVIAFNPCGVCEKKMCLMCELNFRREAAIKNTFIYRPQRSTLDEAMAEKREFASLKQMLEYVVEEHENAFDLDNVFISYYGYDERISWDTYIVCVTRYGDEEYDHPQAIGFCAML